MTLVHSELGGNLNNKYHHFVRLPPPTINKLNSQLRLKEYYDALDVFRYISGLTHQHSFQSRLMYQTELVGIHKRLNSLLKPLGYKLVSRKVPVGIQKAHKVGSDERRWGFEEMKPYELKQYLKKYSVLSRLKELDQIVVDK
uniref:hypothetical protein n=1 Tax=Vibrio nigripulchritudo TaxID=28173 RepID=UPI0015E86162|nr:hypothetical protein [Vibrio nigripulchritudo]